jgi:signal transduction histidine kinase
VITAENDRSWILAIDDDPWALEMTAVTLGEEGWHVQQALSGAEARSIIARLGPPVLVLVDAMMPNEDGFELCRLLRTSAPMRPVPIVFQTALDDENVRVRALEAGADDFLTKPVAATLLKTRVRTLVELHRHRAANVARTRSDLVLDTIGEGVLTLDDDDHVVEANRAARALLGLPRDPLARVHLPEHIARHWKVIRGRTGRDSDARLVYATVDGTVATAIDWISRTLPEDGAETWTVVVRDATDLWERDQALGRMMKSVGHKLRTPLTGLGVSLEFAADQNLDPTSAEMIGMAQRSAQRLQDTIIRILEFVDAAGRPSTALATGFPSIGPDDLTARLSELDLAVSTTMTRPVRIDVALALRAIEELARNARAAGACEVLVQASPCPDRSVMFEVTDNGPGIPVAAGSRVFEPFYQLDRTGEQPGTGLGLSILREEVDRAGGSIGAWPMPGGGTTVWFKLPDHSSIRSEPEFA